MALVPRQFLQTTQINWLLFRNSHKYKSLSDIFFYIFPNQKRRRQISHIRNFFRFKKFKGYPRGYLTPVQAC